MNENHGAAKTGSNRFLLLVAPPRLGRTALRRGGGIISGALLYLEATSKLNAGQLSFIVRRRFCWACDLNSYAGLLRLAGRKKMMALSGILFVISIPDSLAKGYEALVLGRLLQGISAGLIGVVVPLYLAECLDASNRGKGTGIFQWLLTLGIVAAAVYQPVFQPFAWMWWPNSATPKSCLRHRTSPGAASSGFRCRREFCFHRQFHGGRIAALAFRREKKTPPAPRFCVAPAEQAEIELKEMEETVAAEKAKASTGDKIKESLLRRKYIIPFALACVILACNQLTGVNSIIGYNATILIQAGLSDFWAHLGYVFSPSSIS